MNAVQKIVLLLGIGGIVFTGIYPPWVHDSEYKPISGVSAVDYSLITKPPGTVTTIDLKRLGVEWAMVAIVTGGLLVIFKDSKKTKGLPARQNER